MGLMCVCVLKNQETETISTHEQVLPKVIWEELHRKVPTGYNGMPQIHPKTASSPSMITSPI